MALTQDTLTKLRQLVGPENVLTAKEDLIPYSFDGTAALRQMRGEMRAPQPRQRPRRTR